MKNKQTIIIAGATGNIGKAAAIALAKRGTRIVLLGRNPGKLKMTAGSIFNILKETGIDYKDRDIATLAIDFSDMESVKLAAKEALNRFPTINGLVLSVGAFIQNGPNILPSGHERMFATNVMGPFLFTQLLINRLEQSEGIILHVIARFKKEIDWDNLESINNHKAMTAFNRTKVFNRIIAGELARRYAGKISSVAFDPTYVIDKTDPSLKDRWPSGLRGFFWRIMTLLFAKHPAFAGEPIANHMLSHENRHAINGALFKLDKLVKKPEQAMNDEIAGKRLWDQLVKKTGLISEESANNKMLTSS